MRQLWGFFFGKVASLALAKALGQDAIQILESDSQRTRVQRIVEEEEVRKRRGGRRRYKREEEPYSRDAAEAGGGASVKCRRRSRARRA